jgi:hypothetical protein
MPPAALKVAKILTPSRHLPRRPPAATALRRAPRMGWPDLDEVLAPRSPSQPHRSKMIGRRSSPFREDGGAGDKPGCGAERRKRRTWSTSASSRLVSLMVDAGPWCTGEATPASSGGARRASRSSHHRIHGTRVRVCRGEAKQPDRGQQHCCDDQVEESHGSLLRHTRQPRKGGQARCHRGGRLSRQTSKTQGKANTEYHRSVGEGRLSSAARRAG